MEVEPDAILHEVIRRTREVFPDVKRVLLFGSRARGDATTESDYDLLVVVPSLQASEARGAHLRLALRGLDAAFDLIVLTAEEFARLERSQSSNARAVLGEARILHEAA